LDKRPEFRYPFGMTDTEQTILDELLGLERALASLPSADPKPDLVAIFQRIDQLAADLPRDADPQLLHFLQKKSYEKARLHLQGRATARGACG